MNRHRGGSTARWMYLATAIACTFVVLVLPCVVLARAGGGEGWGGGGGGGGGGGWGGGDWGGGGWDGGGGGDGGDGGLIVLIIYLIRFCIRFPHIGLPLLGVGGTLLYFLWRGGHLAHQGSVIRRGVAAHDANREVTGVAQLRERDPAFDPQQFFNRVGSGFLKIQEAWSRQDLSQVRPFISDGIHERFSLQIDEQKLVGYRNAMENVKVHAVRLAQVHSDDLFDEAAVRIDASAADYRISIRDGGVIRGSRVPQPFTEYWSFLRRRGAQTRSDRPGLIEGNCPNCGAEIGMNRFDNCQSCGALLRSGEHDWVLAEITQASEWKPGPRRTLPGLEQLRQRDAQFNLQHLEDRASVMFWRRAMADRLGDVRPLRKIATAGFSDAFAANFRSAGDRSFFGECAVGAVETHGFYRDEGSPEGGAAGRDHALVEVRWSGTQFIIRPGRRIEITDHTLLTRSLFVLARAADAVSDAGRAISSAHCPNCGAPESDTASDSCDYCGQVLNDGSRDWVLTDVVSMASREAQRHLDRLHAPAPQPLSDGHGAARPSDAAMVSWMIRTLLADQSTNSAEHDVLRHLASRRRITESQLETMLRAAGEGQLHAPEPADRNEAVEWLRAMASVAMADGSLHRDEFMMLQRVGQRYGFTSHDFKLMLNRARADLLAEAKSELREQRLRRRNGYAGANQS